MYAPLRGRKGTSNITKIESFLYRKAARIAQYRTTANVLRDHPLLGLGFGTFTRQFQHYKHASTPSSTTTTTENMYLMTASETGLLGLLTFLALLFALIRSLYRNYKAAPPGAARDLHLAALAAVSGFLLNMLTWDALNQPTVRITFWMFAGLGLAQSKYGEKRKNNGAPL